MGRLLKISFADTPPYVDRILQWAKPADLPPAPGGRGGIFSASHH
jgi:hypothetical protein